MNLGSWLLAGYAPSRCRGRVVHHRKTAADRCAGNRRSRTDRTRSGGLHRSPPHRHRRARLARRLPRNALGFRRLRRERSRRPRTPRCTRPRVGAGPNLAVLGAALELSALKRMEQRLGLIAEPYHTGRGGKYLRTAEALSAAGLTGAVFGKSWVRRLAGATLAASAATRWAIFPPAKTPPTIPSTPSFPNVIDYKTRPRGTREVRPQNRAASWCSGRTRQIRLTTTPGNGSHFGVHQRVQDPSAPGRQRRQPRVECAECGVGLGGVIVPALLVARPHRRSAERQESKETCGGQRAAQSTPHRRHIGQRSNRGTAIMRPVRRARRCCGDRIRVRAMGTRLAPMLSRQGTEATRHPVMAVRGQVVGVCGAQQAVSHTHLRTAEALSCRPQRLA